MRMRRFLMAMALWIVASLVGAVLSAKPAYSKKEGKPCATCHTKQGSKELNGTGKIYKEKGALPAEKK